MLSRWMHRASPAPRCAHCWATWSLHTFCSSRSRFATNCFARLVSKASNTAKWDASLLTFATSGIGAAVVLPSARAQTKAAYTRALGDGGMKGEIGAVRLEGVVLADLDAAIADGDTGNNIGDGGNDMYDGGNRLRVKSGSSWSRLMPLPNMYLGQSWYFASL